MRGEIPEAIDQIMRWGGIIDAPTLARMRWPGRKSGNRSARELLSSLATRSYVECVGQLGSRPLYAVTEAGYYVAAANVYMMMAKWAGSPIRKNKSGIRVLPVQLEHTLAVAAETTGWVRRANERARDRDNGGLPPAVSACSAATIPDARPGGRSHRLELASWADDSWIHRSPETGFDAGSGACASPSAPTAALDHGALGRVRVRDGVPDGREERKRCLGKARLRHVRRCGLRLLVLMFLMLSRRARGSPGH